MSHSILRAKRATFTFLVGKSLLKLPKMVHFGDFFQCDILSDFQTLCVGFVDLGNFRILLSILEWKEYEVS